MNAAKYPYSAIAQIEMNYKNLLELNKWLLEVTELFSDRTLCRPYPEEIWVYTEAYTELFTYIKEIA